MRDTGTELSDELLQTLERSIGASPKVFRQRVWRTLDAHGVEIGPLVAKIREDIATERKRGKGRQRRTEYNEPPAELQRRFESVHADTVVPGTKKGAPASVRYRLQGPIEKYKTDFAQAELEAFVRAIENGLAAARQNVTSGYGEGGGGGSKRAGGVIDRQRLAYTTHQHNLSQIPRAWWPIFHRLIEGGITVHEIGQWVLPGVRHEATLRGAGRAALQMMGYVLADVEIKRNGLARGEKTDRRMIDQLRRERQAKREARR
tara:strand:- start:2769 stop:3551 length:783 start_codon:yes stop_codon:yes gene_type:complete